MQSKDKKATGIEQAGKNNPFSVPANYFESFPEKLNNRLQSKRPSPVPFPERAWQLIRPRLALAAVITGFALIGYLGLRTFTSTEQDLANSENIAMYIDFYQEDFSDQYFLSQLEEHDYYFEDPDPDYRLYGDDPDLYIEYLYQDEIAMDLLYAEF